MFAKHVLQQTRKQAMVWMLAIVVLLLSGCSVLEIGVEGTPAPAATHTPPAQSPTEPPARDTPALTPTEPALAVLEPIAEAPALRFESWSPTEAWLSYWQSSEEEVASPAYPFAPGTLRLFNADTRQACVYSEYVSRGYADRLIWQANGDVIVLSGGQASQGDPCNNSFSIVDPPAEESENAAALSPGAGYRAETLIESSSEGVANVVTTIMATAGETLQRIPWTIDERLGELGLAGLWLNETQFLIYETRDQGPLLIDAERGVINVIEELFEGRRDRAELLSRNVTLRAQAGVAADRYHLILSGVGEEGNFPNALLYHSDSGVVEELPFQHVWSQPFSPDGEWLLLDGKFINNEGYEAHALFVREAEATGSDARRLAEIPVSAVFSPDWTRIAFGAGDTLSILSFPDGNLLRSWGGAPYNILNAVWSFDGRYLAALGFVDGLPQQALFVVES